ncbi:hypothetical protein AAFF_G00345310 [Aldrovandia affinis]|uniref:Uncharacterized protein n=1 Tax=Aldrovandia affinis TaxID=143900 RepID=A0AAD7R821_9TELE|nr:hypothetical protein AAFF_G00345310 [Aldrovandia affinis]
MESAEGAELELRPRSDSAVSGQSLALRSFSGLRLLWLSSHYLARGHCGLQSLSNSVTSGHSLAYGSCLAYGQSLACGPPLFSGPWSPSGLSLVIKQDLALRFDDIVQFQRGTSTQLGPCGSSLRSACVSAVD